MGDPVPEVLDERPDDDGPGHVRKIAANDGYWIEVCTTLPDGDLLVSGYLPCDADESIDDHAEAIRRLRRDLDDPW